MSPAVKKLADELKKGQRAIEAHKREIERYNRLYGNALHNQDVQERRDLANEAQDRIKGNQETSRESQEAYDAQVQAVQDAQNAIRGATGKLAEAANIIGTELLNYPGTLGRSLLAKITNVATKVGLAPQIAIAGHRQEKADIAVLQQSAVVDDINADLADIEAERIQVSKDAHAARREFETGPAEDYSAHTKASKFGARQLELAERHDELLVDMGAAAIEMGNLGTIQQAAHDKSAELAKRKADREKAAKDASGLVAESNAKVGEATQQIGQAVSSLLRGFGRFITEGTRERIENVVNNRTQKQTKTAIAQDTEVVQDAEGLRKVTGARPSVSELEGLLEVAQNELNLHMAVNELNKLQLNEAQRSESSEKAQQVFDAQVEATQRSIGEFGTAVGGIFSAFRQVGECAGGRFLNQIKTFGQRVATTTTQVVNAPGRAIAAHQHEKAAAVAEQKQEAADHAGDKESAMVEHRTQIAKAAHNAGTEFQAGASGDYRAHTRAAQLDKQQMEMETLHQELIDATKSAVAEVESARGTEVERAQALATIDDRLHTTRTKLAAAEDDLANSNAAMAVSTNTLKESFKQAKIALWGDRATETRGAVPAALETAEGWVKNLFRRTRESGAERANARAIKKQQAHVASLGGEIQTDTTPATGGGTGFRKPEEQTRTPLPQAAHHPEKKDEGMMQ